MQKFDKIIDYFIHYEIIDRLHNIELKDGKGIYISKDSFCDVKVIRKKISDTKVDKIYNLIKKIKFKDNKYSFQILPDVMQLLTITNINKRSKINEYLMRIIDRKEYCFPNNYDQDIYNISSIILDDTLIVLYPILAKGKRKVPLVTFECKIEEDKCVIKNYKIQQEAFRVIIASILNCGIREVNDFLGHEFYELLNSLSSIENTDIFETIKIIDEDIKGKFINEEFTSLWNVKNYEWWAVTEELVITIEAFEELQQPIFCEELKHLKELTKDSDVPRLIQKYLYYNNKSLPISSVKNGFHYGSYDSGFSVNEKQWKVISAYNSNDLISVSGPPGTGKTTILKEIIADNFVRKIKALISVWDKPWEEFGQGNQKVFCSPFNGECNKSMILTSINNDAVDNIGLELLREVEYFNEIAQNNLSKKFENEIFKGIFCARLGKKDNMDSFNLGALRPLIELLKNSVDYDEQLSLQLIEDFKQSLVSMTSAEIEIIDYINNRTNIFNQLLQNKLIEGEATIELVQAAKNETHSKYEKLIELIKNNEENINVCKNELTDINKSLTGALNNIKQDKTEINNIKAVIDQINKYRRIPLIGRLIIQITKIEKKNGTKNELESQLEEKNCEMRHYNSVRDGMFQEYEEESKRIELIKSELTEQTEVCKKLKEEFIIFEKFQELMRNFDSMKEKYLLSCSWNDNEYLLFNDIEFTKKRNQLFNLGLRINEAYIKKNKNEIIFNLEKVYPDKWFQAFYRGNFKYDEIYTKCIKVMWETLFLCFPIITTTLHSFDKNKFHMIEGIFDTIMFDESGQALLHTAVAPLFRARKAIIVGDIFQLEPIRGNEKHLVEIYEFDSKTESFIDLDQNSVQHGADRGSDIFEVLNNQKVGIILDEHRRCEEAIVKFSNTYVYEKRLKIIKQNERKKFLERNLCFIDVRGTKNKNNENSSEVNICYNIVKILKEHYGEEYESKIGIITPFKNQAKLLSSYIKNVDVGTVHSFQGQEKEIIILSTAIDDTQRNSGINFVGRKSNFLNVAFTRAKKQLIMVGNYEACKNGNNYLMHAIETIEKYGYIYSIYKTDLTENIDKKYIRQFLELFKVEESPVQRYDELFRGFTVDGLLVEPRKHYDFLINVIQKSNKSIHIVSPWITKAVVNDKMIELIIQKINNNNQFWICFGYNKTQYTLDQVEKIVEKDNFRDRTGPLEAINKLKDTLKDNLKYLPPIHTKALIVDEEFMLIGSHNWLSNSGSKRNAKDEISCVISDKKMIEYVKKRYF